MARCLFVDDSGLIRKVAKRILAGVGVSVVEADCAAAGLAACAAEMPEIIVVDGALPDMDAADFIRQVRAMAGQVVPQIMLCVVEVDVAAIMRAKRAGAQGFMLKPFNRAQLLQSLSSLSVAA